jgi:outer membrane immunogenic protein
MRRTILNTTVALGMVVATGPAFAGNLSEPVIVAAPPPVMMPVAVNTGGDWTGFYVGGSLGFAKVDDEAGTFGNDFEGLTYGAHAGYDYDFGSFVLGGELEVSGFDVNDSVTATQVDSVVRLKARAGYDAGLFLPYVTAGVAQLTTSGAPLGDVDDNGVFYGIGMDYKLADNLRLGGEVLQHDFDDYASSGLNIDALTAGVRVSFEF